MGDFKEGIVHPYISRDTMWHETGSLADYLGIPSTYASNDNHLHEQFPVSGLYTRIRETVNNNYTLTGSDSTIGETNDLGFTAGTTVSYTINNDLATQNRTHETLVVPYPLYVVNNSGSSELMRPQSELGLYLTTMQGVNNADAYGYVTHSLNDITLEKAEFDFPSSTTTSNLNITVIYCDNVQDPNVFSPMYESWRLEPTFTFSYDGSKYVTANPDDFLWYFNRAQREHTNVRLFIWSSDGSTISYDGAQNIGQSIGIYHIVDTLTDVLPTDSPFVVQSGEEFPKVRINALPFRAYESIYNCYFRSNPTVDPFTLNGEPEYNRWITNDGDGADTTTPLYLRQRNFELDFLTSAVNSPQQGEAPLVGVSSTGTFTFRDENNVEYTAQAVIDPDTGKLTGIDTYDPNLPASSLHRLMDTITHGISINDFRNVSALQAWKEKMIRRGYRYKSIIQSHFGVDAKSVHYDDPQFIGGFSRNINVNQITSSTSTTEINLGDYGGQASLFANSEHSITTYCDEHCFIIGVLTIVPIPVYSQLLDPMWNKDNILSYAWPEFNHLGYQAISYRNVTPIESYMKSKDTGEDELNKTFGYQRPYWEYVAKTDQAHSHMRTDMSNYLMTRYFATPPELGHDFLEVNPAHLTSPFVDTDAQADNIIGQIYFDISAQRPISRMAIPRLEP